MKRLIATITLVIVFSTLALAHGKEKHVMGKVTNISGNVITVETTAKKSVTVNVSDETKFQKSGAAATLKDLKVGDKVVIHAEEEDGKLTAHQVRFGAMPSGQKPAEHAAHSHAPESTTPKQ